MKHTDAMGIIDNVKWLWGCSRGFRLRILLGALCGILRVGVSILFVWISKLLIDIATGEAEGDIAHTLLFMVGCILCQLLLSSLSNRIVVHTEITLSNKMREGLLAHVLKSKWSGREKYHTGDIVNRVENDVATITSLLCGTVPAVVITLTQFLAAAIFLAWLDVRLALIILFVMPFALLFSKLYMKKMRRLTGEIRSTDSRIQSHLQENLQHRTLISTLERTATVTDTMGALQSGLKSLVMRRNSFSIFSGVMVQAGFACGYVTAFAWGVYGVSSGAVTFGMMTAFLQLVSQVQRPVVELSRYVPAFINAFTSVDRIVEVYSLPLEQQGEAVVLKGVPGISLADVSFAYPDGKRNVIEAFTYDFKPGSLTAVLGETGSGKSTLVRLMLALLLPDKGDIVLYDGAQRVAASPLTRGNFIYVPQGNTLVSGTLRDNLLLGNPDATDAQMLEALHVAAADFVDELPLGLDTPCGEAGAGFSEGQAQRVAIARGLLRPGGIVLLDEPTSSLDSGTEKLLLERLSNRVKNKTFIVITHQQQTAQLCHSTVSLS